MKKFYTQIDSAKCLARVFFCTLLFLASISDVSATHYRSGNINWSHGTNDTIIFQVNQSWRWSFFGNPSIGSVVNVGTFNFGDGSTQSLNITINATNPVDDWFTGAAVIKKKYAVSGSYNARFQNCCRLSSLLNGNNDRDAINQVTVTAGNGNNSPVSVAPPIVSFPVNIASSFTIPAFDPDGDSFTYSITPASLSGLLVTAPSGLTLSSAGLINWTPTSLGLYAINITLTDSLGATSVSDFIIRVGAVSNPPTFDYSITPINNYVYHVSPGTPVSFTVKADDIDLGNTVSLVAIGMPPSGPTFLPALPVTGNPSSTTFSWTPGIADITAHVISFIATDNTGAQAITTVVVNVTPGPVFDVPPTPIAGNGFCVLSGTPFSTNIQAQSNAGTVDLSISSMSGLPPGATTSPALPTAMAPIALTTLNWTPTPADWGSHTVTFTASNVNAISNTHSFNFLINTSPVITSGSPPTSANVGQLYTYTLTATDANTPYGDVLSFHEIDLPSWLTLTNNGNGTAVISGTPTCSDTGDYDFTLIVEDIHHHCGPHVDMHVHLDVLSPANPLAANASGSNVVCSGDANGTASVQLTGGATTISRTYLMKNVNLTTAGFNIGCPPNTQAYASSLTGPEYGFMFTDDLPPGATITDIQLEASFYLNCNGYNPRTVRLNNQIAGSIIPNNTDCSGCSSPAAVNSATLNGSLGAYTIGGSNTLSLEMNFVNFEGLIANPSWDDAYARVHVTATMPVSYAWNTVPVQTTQSISNLPQGVYCVTGTDAFGCTASTCYSVLEVDTVPPVIICPSNITDTIDLGQCGAIVNYTIPTATDNCAVASQPVTNTYTYNGSLQNFTVPAGVTSLTIRAKGASGGTISQAGNLPGGRGSDMQGEFAVTPGQVLNIIVGGEGNPSQYTSGGGGASGVGIGTTPLIVAGGGAGIDFQDTGYPGIHAVVTPNGIDGNFNPGSGGTAGSDGLDFAYTPNDISRGGRGWNTNVLGSFGLNGQSSNTTTTNGTWGIGGGGGSVGSGWCNCGAGGGGYSGGGSANINQSGGGGGSYNAGSNQVNAGGVHYGNGVVEITYSAIPPVSVTQINGLPSGSNFPVGTTVNTFVATDLSGNTDTCSFNVIVLDTEAPTIVCPANISVNNDPNQCGATVTYNTPLGTDNCTGAITTQTAGLASGSVFPVGTTTNTFVVTDATGNLATCSFNVTVIGAASTIVCPSNITISNDSGICGAVVTYPMPTVNSACPCTTPTSIPGYTALGTYNGHAYFQSTFATDWNTANNNAIALGGHLAVVNDAAENAFLAALSNDGWIGLNDELVEGDYVWSNGEPFTYSNWAFGEPNNAGDEDYIQLYGTGEWNDLPGYIQLNYIVEFDCSGMNLTGGLASGSVFPVGTTTVSYQYVDANGLSDTCSFNVTVNDTEAPVLLHSNTILNTNFESGLPSGWSATGLWHVTSSCASGTPPNGTQWAYYGSDATCNFNVGNTSGALSTPSITIPAGANSAALKFYSYYSGEGGSPYDLAALRVNGTEVLNVSSNYVQQTWNLVSVDLSAYIGQTITIDWFFNTVDGIANNSLGWQIDSVSLSTNTTGCPPALTFNVNSNCSYTGNLIPPTANDNCDGPVAVSGPVPAGPYSVGTTTVTWTTTDLAGNSRVCTQDITVLPAANGGSMSIFSCGPYVWTSTTFFVSGTYTKTFTNVLGCDSVHVMHLTVGSANSGSSSEMACDSYNWNGTLYTVSGNYTQTFTNTSGCDSVHTLSLTIKQSSNGSSTLSACDSYTWNGTTYTTSGMYAQTFTNAVGCDSLHTISLSINTASSGSSAVTNCDSYIWNGTTYTTSGAYTQTFTNAGGCDSVHVLNLTINSSTFNTTNANATGCYTWNVTGLTYTISGTYTQTSLNQSGCVHTEILQLALIPMVQLQTKVMLSGSYQTATGMMHDSLRVNGLIPFTEPYSSSPFNRPAIAEPSGETFDPSILAVSGPDAIIDWIFLELRAASNPAVIVATKRALLQRDGDVVSHTDGVSPVRFTNTPDGMYYVSIKHRNHLGVMSHQAISLSGCAANSFDFTLPGVVFVNPSISNAPRRIVGGLHALWAGDANGNKNAKYNGSSNDKDAVLMSIGIATPNNSVVGYRIEDCNMDGKIRYNSTDNDRLVILNSVGVSTPNIVLNQHTPN